MSKKISNYFKVVPKVNKNLNLKSEESTNIKNEPEVSFEINFNQINSKNKEISSNPPKIRDCKVILEDINKTQEVQDNELKNRPAANGSNPKTRKKLAIPTECEFCGLKMLKSSIKTHIERRHSEKVKSSKFICVLCDQKFSDSKSLKAHVARIHSEILKSQHFECDFDGKIFKNRDKFKGHMKYHQQKVKCELCEIEISPSNLRKHFLRIHKNERKHQCEICQKSFKLKNSLTVHVRTHDKNFECQICSKLCPSKWSLNSHNKFYHENPGSFECEICGFKFNEKGDLRKHQRIHDRNRLKPYKCQICDYSTDTKHNLEVHQKHHENQDKKFTELENPYKCEKCLKFFKNKRRMTQHKRRVHSNDLFQCDLCGKYIKFKRNIFAHIEKRICQKN